MPAFLTQASCSMEALPMQAPWSMPAFLTPVFPTQVSMRVPRRSMQGGLMRGSSMRAFSPPMQVLPRLTLAPTSEAWAAIAPAVIVSRARARG